MSVKDILTPRQLEVLRVLNKESYVVKNFYWTGGTVLAQFYLGHRYSEDIDLFSEREVEVGAVNSLVERLRRQVGATEVRYQNYLGLHTYFLIFPNGQLKLDFNYYPFTRIEKGGKYENLGYDSYVDILANKIQTLYTSPRGRDLIDLYFAFKKEKFLVEDLIKLARAKFDWPIDPLQLAAQILKAEKLPDLPRLILPFDKEDFRQFSEGLVLELKIKVAK